jgi:hypothetical protein
MVTDIQEFMPYEGHNVTGNFIDIVHHGIFWSSSDNPASTSWYSDHLHKRLIYVWVVLVGIWEIDCGSCETVNSLWDMRLGL